MAKGKDKKKPRALRSRGSMQDRSRNVRYATAAVLALSCASLSFTQLGFAGFDLSASESLYAVLLLIPVAIGGLLLGTRSGSLLGAFAGACLYLHANVMPLDTYELSFVTPLTSVVMLGVSGFLMALMFAFALRNGPSRIRRVIYIAIVCAIVSVLYSIGFLVNTLLSMAVNLASSNVSGLSDEQIRVLIEGNLLKTAMRVGNADMQALVDALLMALTCSVADACERQSRKLEGEKGLRTVFATRLTIVAFSVFMLVAGVSFAAITQAQIADAAKTMKGEVSYLRAQMNRESSNAQSLIELLGRMGSEVPEANADAIQNAFVSAATNGLLDGYSQEADGTILLLSRSSTGSDSDILAEDYVVKLSDDESLPEGTVLNALYEGDFIAAIEKSLETGEIRRTVFDQTNGRPLAELLSSAEPFNSDIAYLYAEQQDDYIVMIMYSSGKVFSARGDVMLWSALSTFALLAAVFGVVFLLLSDVVIRRIDETNGVLGRITQGDLDASVDIRDTKEFESLSKGINETVGALKGWIAEAESRMDAELSTAKAIQESALPRTFPPFPDISRFDVYASMKAAREVGGDFYDFFLIDDDQGKDAGKLGFVVADVSGKGVPAALFMMKAKTLIRDYILSGMEVGEAIENVNRQLCDGNDANMFVTAWVGVLDYASGHVEYVNAGHNPPLFWSEGSWRWLPDKSGLPLGLFDGMPYGSYSVNCQIGDQFFVYTDGVTEAMNVEGDLYGESRLEELLKGNCFLHPRNLVRAARRDVARYAKGAEQSDDITILALEYGVPPEVTATITVPADVDKLPAVNEFIHTELDRRLCPLRTQNQIDIAVEELFVNVAHYAYPDAAPEEPGVVRVSYTYSAEPPSVRIVIADEGVPYDPLAKPDAVTPDDIMEVPIGGLGILMAKRSVDSMEYERIEGSNVVSITKKW